MIKCPKHPKYQGKRIPIHKNEKQDCWCHEIFLAKRDGYDLEWITDSKGNKHLVEL